MTWTNPTKAQGVEQHLSSKRLSQVLLEIAERENIQIVFSTEEVNRFQAAPYTETLELRARLKSVLKHSSLGFVFKAKDFVLVRKKQNIKPTLKSAQRPINHSDVDRVSFLNQKPVFERIVVKGRQQKGSLSLLRSSVSVSSLSRSFILDSGINRLDHSLRHIPGVNSREDGEGAVDIAIRGSGGSSVGYFLDGLPFKGATSAINPNIGMFDVERIEVYRGPQGYLFGEGSLGGAIRVNTTDPDLSMWGSRLEGEFAFSTSANDSYGLRAMVNIPLIEEKLAFRGSFSNQVDGGFITRAQSVYLQRNYNENRISNNRVKLRLMPSDQIDMVFAHWVFDYQSAGNNMAYDDFTINLAPSLPTRLTYSLSTAKLTYAFGHNEFSLLLGNSQFSKRSVSDLPYAEHQYRPIDLSSSEIRYELEPVTGLDVLVGYAVTQTRRAQHLHTPMMGMHHFEGMTVVDSSSLYAEAAFQFLSDWTVSVGVRGEHEENSFDGGANGLNHPIELPLNYSVKSSNVSPRMTVSYDVSEDLSFFTNVSHGFRNPVVHSLGVRHGTGLMNIKPSLQLENVWGYEVGSKYQFDDGLSIDGSLFVLDWRGRLVEKGQELQLSNLELNKDSNRSIGIESSIVKPFPNGVTAYMDMSYIDSGTDAKVGYGFVANHSSAEFNARLTLGASLIYRGEIRDGIAPFANLGMSYASFYYRSPMDLYSRFAVKKLLFVDARLGIEGDNWGVYLFGNNLTNQKAILGNELYTLNNAKLGARPRPRTFGLELVAKY